MNILSLLIQKPHSLQMILQSQIISLTQICSCKCADYSLSILGWGLWLLDHVLQRAEWTGSVPQQSLSQKWILHSCLLLNINEISVNYNNSLSCALRCQKLAQSHTVKEQRWDLNWGHLITKPELSTSMLCCPIFLYWACAILFWIQWLRTWSLTACI